MNPISEKIEKFLNEGEQSKLTYRPHREIKVGHDEDLTSDYGTPMHKIETTKSNMTNVTSMNTDDLKKLHKAIGDHLSKLDDKATEQREKQAYSQSA